MSSLFLFIFHMCSFLAVEFCYFQQQIRILREFVCLQPAGNTWKATTWFRNDKREEKKPSTPPSMNRLSKAILYSKKQGFCSFFFYSLNSFPFEILSKWPPNSLQIVSHTPKMTPENAMKNSMNRLFIEQVWFSGYSILVVLVGVCLRIRQETWGKGVKMSRERSPRGSDMRLFRDPQKKEKRMRQVHLVLDG